jgi:hypothetical protein
MMAFWSIWLVFTLLVSGCLSAFSPKISSVDGFQMVKTSNSSTLYRINSTSSDYTHAPYLVDLHGSHYEMGYAYGYVV